MWVPDGSLNQEYIAMKTTNAQWAGTWKRLSQRGVQHRHYSGAESKAVLKIQTPSPGPILLSSLPVRINTEKKWIQSGKEYVETKCYKTTFRAAMPGEVRGAPIPGRKGKSSLQEDGGGMEQIQLRACNPAVQHSTNQCLLSKQKHSPDSSCGSLPAPLI